MMVHDLDIRLLILAAGEGSRMGRPKQLLPVLGSPLIDFQIRRWQGVSKKRPVVVLGAYAEKVRLASRQSEVNWVVNPDWEKGMGSSVKTGIRHLFALDAPPVGCVLILMDQCLVGPSELHKLINAAQLHPEKITATIHGSGFGPPVYFPRHFWDDLLKLKDHQGAKPFLAHHRDQVFGIDSRHASFDLDTPEEYAQFLRMLNPLTD